MSRVIIVLLLILALLAAGLYALAGIDTETPTSRVVRDVPNEKLAR